jgi:hypothetical protein
MGQGGEVSRKMKMFHTQVCFLAVNRLEKPSVCIMNDNQKEEALLWQ